MAHEVTPHIPDAWVSDAAGKVGYEIPFTRIFYSSTPQRPSSEIKAELAELEGEIQELLGGMLE
jgi:type I restriction enzyme M protein